MDPTIQWLRREITWYLARRLFAEYTLGCIVLTGVLIASGRSVIDAGAHALVGAQAIVLVRIVLGITRNPVSFWASRRSTEDPLRLIATPHSTGNEAETPPTMLEAAGYVPAVTARASSADGEPLYDVYQRPDFITTLAIGRAGNSRVLISRLRDGRLLVSTDLLVLPSSQLIVNVVTKPMQRSGADQHGPSVGATGAQQQDDTEQDPILQAILHSHNRLIEGLRSKGVFAEPAHPSVFVELLNLEQKNFDELGPFLTPFLSLTCRRSPLQLSLVLEPRTVLSRSPLGTGQRTRQVAIANEQRSSDPEHPNGVNQVRVPST